MKKGTQKLADKDKNIGTMADGDWDAETTKRVHKLGFVERRILKLWQMNRRM
jgi:hypothetical protein